MLRWGRMGTQRARSFRLAKWGALLLIAPGLAVGVGGATELSFSLEGVDDGDAIPIGYGDRVDVFEPGGYFYGAGGGSTPAVLIDFAPVLAAPIIGSDGFGDLADVVLMHPLAGGIMEVRFAADEEFDVRLLGWVIAARASAFGEDPVIDRIEVIDGRSFEVLFEKANVGVPREENLVFDFSDQELVLRSRDLVLRVDAHSLEDAAIHIALDEITFSQDPPAIGRDGPSAHLSVDFPAGDVSFADRVVSLRTAAGPGPIPTLVQNGNEALGAPDYESDVESAAVALGGGGQLTVEFVDNLLTSDGDASPDLAVFEVDAQVEAVAIEVSSDGVLWEHVGLSSGGVSLIDLDAHGFDANARLRFVRITDDSSDPPGEQPTPGADIDAVGAITTVAGDGGITATFDDPKGDEDMVVSGVGTTFFTWGEPRFTPFPSNLQFRPGDYGGGVEKEFHLGTLTYVNGSTAEGTTANRVSLTVLLDTGGGNEPVPFVFPLELISTPNDGPDPVNDADIVRLPNIFSNEAISIEGRAYRLRLTFESISAGGIGEIDRFFVFEGSGATAVLRGVLTLESPLDGCPPRRITFDHNNEMYPAWDPRDDTIAFATDRQPGGKQFDIGAVQTDSTDERLLATGIKTEGGLARGAISWRGLSGKLLITEAVNLSEVLEFEVRKAPFTRALFDGNDQEGAFARLLKFSEPGGFFVASRDGTAALWRDWDGKRSTLRTISYPDLVDLADGDPFASQVGTVWREFQGLAFREVMHSAALATDGSFLVLSELVRGESQAEGYDLLLIETTGAAEPVTLTTSGKAEGMINQNPSVSPDGRHVAFTRSDGEGEVSDIFVMTLGSGEERNVTSSPEISETHPHWSPDGGSLVYSRYDALGSPDLRTDEPGNWNLYVQCLERLNDRDGDGVVDLLEEAFGSDPNVYDSPAMPVVVTVTVSGVVRTGIAFDAVAGGEAVAGGTWVAGEFEYRIEVSDDLEDWALGSEQTVEFQREPLVEPGAAIRDRLTVLLVETELNAVGNYMRVVVRRVNGEAR